jgi:hypothetical protein
METISSRKLAVLLSEPQLLESLAISDTEQSLLDSDNECLMYDYKPLDTLVKDGDNGQMESGITGRFQMGRNVKVQRKPGTFHWLNWATGCSKGHNDILYSSNCYTVQFIKSWGGGMCSNQDLRSGLGNQ